MLIWKAFMKCLLPSSYRQATMQIVRLTMMISMLVLSIDHTSEANDVVIELLLTIESETQPNEVVANVNGFISGSNFNIVQDKTQNGRWVYNTTISFPEENWAIDFTISATWDSQDETWSENLYLRSNADSMRSVSLTIYRFKGRPNEKSLQYLDDLGSTLPDLVRKYLFSRAIYKMMDNKRHMVAIKSARLWLDSSNQLMNFNSAFRMDPDAVRVNEQYELEAASSASFRQTYRMVNREGYIQGSKIQGELFSWQEVSLIPRLVEKGDLVAAESANSYFIDAFASLASSDRENVAKLWGVDGDLLARNAEYIESLRKRRRY